MKVINIEDKITFNDGTTIRDYHEQECYESVYADFTALEDTSIFELDFDRIEVEHVEGSGFRLNGFFIPCYNRQNGFYSSYLSLIITHPDGREEIVDISYCTEKL